MIPHVNVNGYAGVGKTTVLSLISYKYKVLWIPRLTTRLPRPGENRNAEYKFISNEEFQQMRKSRQEGHDAIVSDISDEEIVYNVIYKREDEPVPSLCLGDTGAEIFKFSDHQVFVRGGSYWTGVPHPRTWPEVRPETELILSTFGYFSPIVKQNYIRQENYPPTMINIFITLSDKQELRRRLYERSRKKKLNFREQWEKNLKHMEQHEEEKYDYVLYNDGAPEECATQIERIAGLRSPED